MGYQRRVHGGRSNPVSPETPPKSKQPSSTQIRMASRLAILLLLCLIPLLASALGEEERSHEVDAPSAELQASVVKREARKCRGKGKKACKKRKGSAKKKGKKSKSERRQRQRQRNTKPKIKKNNTKNKNKNKVEAKENERKFSGRTTGQGRQITGNATS